MLSPTKRAAFTLTMLILAFLVVFGSAEIVSRYAGYAPYKAEQRYSNRVVEPRDDATTDETVGFKFKPGRYTVTIDGKFTFSATHDADGRRVTGAESGESEIWVFGDSITYGQSVNDSETYPWLLQEQFPELRFVNFGVSGYGSVHSLLQLRAALDVTKPKAVILAYASFHDERNALTRNWRKQVASVPGMANVTHPYARIGNGKLVTFHETNLYQEFPLMRYTALMHLVEQAYNNIEEVGRQKVTQAIIKEMADICEENGISFIVAALTEDQSTSDLFDYCLAEGIQTTSMYIDFYRTENNNLPFDSHPNANAHRQYAEKLAPLIRQF